MVGAERPLGYNVTVYAGFERRYDIDQNRYIVGFRYNFGGKF
jgi:hypothetical protein